MVSKARWVVILLGLLVCSSFGLWDPDSDPCLVFNLNFENNPSWDQTVDAVAGLVGDVNKLDPLFEYIGPWQSIYGIYGSKTCDFALDAGSGDVNELHILVEPDPIFDCGTADHKFTWTFWFYAPRLDAATFIRRDYIPYPGPTYENNWWEIQITDGLLHFHHDNNYLRMNTQQALVDLGVTENEWHHAAVVVDRTAQYNSKIYIDGLEASVVVTQYDPNGDASVDAGYDLAPLHVGSGEHAFDGYLDDIRLYHRVLTPQEVSILYQINPLDANEPIALSPIPRSQNVPITTGLSWEPNPNATQQEVYFNTTPDFSDPNTIVIVTSGTDNFVSNAEIGGPLALNTTYYWEVNSPQDTNNQAPIWWFTTETGKPFNPWPEDDAENIPDDIITLTWTGSASATSFDVYFSDNKTLVENNDVSVRIADDITTSYVDANAALKGETYYWRVVCNFDTGSVAGDVWKFRTEPKLIIVNTSDAAVIYDDVNYGPLTLTWDSNVYTGTLGEDDTAIFSFTGDVNFTDRYDIVVIPLFDNEVEADMNANGYRDTSRPMAIHVDGNLYFNCKLNASGLDAPITQGGPSSQARCGGYRGSFEDENPLPEDYKIAHFGPGYGGTSTDYPCGSGGGYGGRGGDNPRAGAGSGGDTYGYEEVPVPLGGSAGGWSSNAAGGPGGGAVELVATGDIVIGPEAEILVEGGDCPRTSYGAGGGAGGSVRIIAGNDFINEGIISANGGAGGDTLQYGEPDNPGGGGGGGRIAIYYGGTYTNNGQITAEGGPRGSRPEDPDPANPNRSAPGEDGTILITNEDPRKAILPTPADGSLYRLDIGQTQVELKWYPGFGATGPNANRLYFGTDPNSLPLIATKSGDLRAEQSQTVTVSSGNTYYWYVETTTSTGTVTSDLWSFTAVEYYELVFNTSDSSVEYNGQTIDAYECWLHDTNGWSLVTTGSLDAGGVAVFDFTSGFNYGQHDIIVLPEYAPDANVSAPLGIHVSGGDFYFNGTLDISGEDAASLTDEPGAFSGGYRGPRAGDNGDYPDLTGNYTSFTLYSPIEHRFGEDTGTDKTGYIPDTGAYAKFGPGTALIPPLECSGGGGYGGIGGDSGRGYWYGTFSGGASYGDKEIPIPFGGSAGGWGRNLPGGAGGGGVEIIVNGGNVTLGPNAQILAEGGSILSAASKPGGGGAGGSVKVVTSGSFTNNGLISVNGGKGGDTAEKIHQAGGGGAGGRVSIIYGTTCTPGQITAQGGAKGTYVGSPPSEGYASDGEDGTIYIASGGFTEAKKASAPTPKDGQIVYIGDLTELKWYSGYGASYDRVYFGTSPGSLSPQGSNVTATRGQHSISTGSLSPSITAGNTYYWMIKTDGSVDSDIWSFTVVDWQCANPLTDEIVWDTGYYYNCMVDFEDFVELARCWLIGEVDEEVLAEFVEEWLVDTR